LHEFTIASLIVDTLLDLAKKQGSNRVVEVHLKIGKLRSLSAEQVHFSYGILTRGNILEGSRLIIEEVAANVHCSKCGYDSKLDPDDDSPYHFALPSLRCPRCQGILQIIGGDECIISRVKMSLHSGRKENSSEQSEKAAE
jgi:hydrogenase nickel insertion protein HypA